MTGVGATVGVPAMVVSTSVAVAGVANMVTGLAGVTNVMKSPVSSTSGTQASPSPDPKPLHGDRLESTKPAQGYSLRDRTTGEVLKYGETTLGKGRYSQTYLDKNNADMKFEANGTKAEMHKWQNDKILDYRAQHGGQRPPLNKSDW